MTQLICNLDNEEIHKRTLFMAAFLAPWADPDNAENLKKEFEELYGKPDQ